MRQLVISVAIVLAGAATVLAQETTGTITGQVVDSQGMVIPGVTVTVVGSQGTKSTTTNSDGHFRRRIPVRRQVLLNARVR